MQQEFLNEIIANKRDINDQIFLDYFKYQNPFLSGKDLIFTKQIKNENLVNNIDNGLIDLKNDINKK